MTLIPWLPIFMVALSSFVLIVQLTLLYHSRRFGNPMPTYWRGSMLQMLGFLIRYGRLVLAETIPPMWGNVLDLMAMPLIVVGGVVTLVEWRQVSKLSAKPEPPQADEPERTPMR